MFQQSPDRKEGLNRVDSQYRRKPSASADEQYQHIPVTSSPPTVGPGSAPVPPTVGTGLAPVRPEAVSPSSDRIEEPTYQEHRGNVSGQSTVEPPSFYPADLPDRQLQDWPLNRQEGAGKSRSPYEPSANGQERIVTSRNPYGSPQQGPALYTPYRQSPPISPYAPYSQQYRGAPIPYTNPQAYQQSSNEYAQQPPSPYSGYPAQRPQLPYPGYPPQPQPPYPGYPYQGYYAPNDYQQRGYPGYPPAYPYVWNPPRPRRNGYQLGMAITSLVGSILAILAGLLCGIVLLRLVLSPPYTSASQAAQLFGANVLITALMLAGIVGGGFGVFHSAFALARRPSRPLKLPRFWSFLSIYVVLIIVGLMVGGNDVIVNNLPLSFSLIALSGILPALTFFTLALQRVRRPKTSEWPTTWRRFTVALVSGATSAIFLAIVFEGILTLIAGLQFINANTSFIDNPGAPVPHDPRTILFLITLVSVIAPIIEEGFKPLAVITMIGRIRSASEAFILGMACGIGFDIIETTGYIGQGYQGWINVAIERSTAGLLHGFGAGMMALGWYYVTHKDALKRNHLQIGVGCMLYAILQHAIWNGSFVLMLLPAPIGPFLENGKLPIFAYQLDAFFIVYVLLSVLMLCFLWFVTGKIRLQPDASLKSDEKGRTQ